jgi:hypothetical protein
MSESLEGIVRVQYVDPWEESEIIQGRYFELYPQSMQLEGSVMYKGTVVLYGTKLSAPIMKEHLHPVPKEEQEKVREAIGNKKKYQMLHHVGCKLDLVLNRIQELIWEIDHDARIQFYRSVDELISDLQASLEDGGEDNPDYIMEEIKGKWSEMKALLQQLNFLEESFIREQKKRV